MTFQSYLLLKKLKAAQIRLDDPIRVNTNDGLIETANRNLNDRKRVPVSGHFWDTHLNLAIEDLSQGGYIVLLSADLSGNYDYRISSQGLYFTQHLFSSISRFLAKSVVVPVVVSVATTLLVNWLK